MTDWQKAREAAVRAICATEKAEHGCACDPNVETPYGPGVRGCWLLADEKLVAALSAFEKAGFVLVPKQASPEMFNAAGISVSGPYVSSDEADVIWDNMIAAALEERK